MPPDMQPDLAPPQDLDPARLRWQCRRGMLELEVLLQSFLDRVYPVLAEREQRAFQTLLTYPDPQLLDWLMGRTVAADTEIADVVARVRATPLD
jgi:antitoxin CptB